MRFDTEEELEEFLAANWFDLRAGMLASLAPDDAVVALDDAVIMRQLPIDGAGKGGGTGFADLFEMGLGHCRDGGLAAVMHIVELKNDKARLKDLEQLARYCAGFERQIEKEKGVRFFCFGSLLAPKYGPEMMGCSLPPRFAMARFQLCPLSGIKFEPASTRSKGPCALASDAARALMRGYIHHEAREAAE